MQSGVPLLSACSISEPWLSRECRKFAETSGGGGAVLKRAIPFVCAIFYYILLRHLPASTMPGGRIWRSLRFAFCRHIFLSCGTNVNIEHGAKFGTGRTISIGSNSGIGINAWVEQQTKIGNDVMMGEDVMIFSRNHQTTRLDVPMTMQGFESHRPVEIGDDVWIGARALILPGVKVGNGCVIGAGAVVSKDVPDGSIVVGNPARVVRNRYANRGTSC